MSHRYNKAGHPTTPEVAEQIERVRDILFRAYGLDYEFSIVAQGNVLASSQRDGRVIHAVVSRGGKT